MAAIGYVRTSKREQNPANQIMMLLQEGIPQDLIFVDTGVSGVMRADERPGFQAMMEYIDTHPGVSRLVTFEVSRLGRSFLDTLSIINDLERRGVKVWSLSPAEAWTRMEDMRVRELMLAILTWVAQRERENLIERTKIGQERARVEGKTIGRPRREIDMRKVKGYLDRRISVSAISRIMDISYSTLRRRLKETAAEQNTSKIYSCCK